MIRKDRTPHPTSTGFSLIEMLVVVAIVGILAGVALPFLQFGEQRVKERELRHALRELRTAIDAYRQAVLEGRIPRKPGDSGYPPSLEVLVEGVADSRSPTQAKIYFLRRLPRDPFSPAGVEGRPNWGLRSYASPPHEPQPGDDVFDVYSLNTGIGSNGVAYREW